MPFTSLSTVAALIAFLLLSPNLSAQTTQPTTKPGQWTQLFNGKSLDGFYTFIANGQKNVDPEGYFKVTDGMIHVLGIPATDARKPYGYFATEKAYDNFHLRVQYKWGEKKFVPRAADPRDSGVLYLMHGNDKVWPNSIECQVQEGDTGEMIIVGNNLVTSVPVKMRGNQRVFSPGGAAMDVTSGRIYKEPVPDLKTDWNTVEVIVKGNSAVHIVNGVVIMSITDIKLNDSKQPLTSGKIVFQAEGAELFYRNIEIRPLSADESLPAPTKLAP